MPPAQAARALSALRPDPGVLSARALDDGELAELLRPWLGPAEQAALPVPAVIEARLRDGTDLDALRARIVAAAPGALVESQDVWARRLGTLARSLQACAALAVAVVSGVAVAVVTVATRAGLATRRDSVEIVHGLGATDGYVAARFAGRAMRLAGLGAAAGAALALPVLLGLAALAAPVWEMAAGLPTALWAAVPVLPVLAAAIGWATAQITVRRWLRRLP